MSLAIIVGVISFITTKLTDIETYSNTIYNTIEMKNRFKDGAQLGTEYNSGDILIDDFTFLPSIDYKIFNLGNIDEGYADIIEFNEDRSDYHLDFEALKQYVKFYIKIYYHGSEVEEKILRSEMVPCTREMFKSLNENALSDYKIEKRLCPDMDKIKKELRVKNSYSNKEERISFSI